VLGRPIRGSLVSGQRRFAVSGSGWVVCDFGRSSLQATASPDRRGGVHHDRRVRPRDRPNPRRSAKIREVNRLAAGTKSGIATSVCSAATNPHRPLTGDRPFPRRQLAKRFRNLERMPRRMDRFVGLCACLTFDAYTRGGGSTEPYSVRTDPVPHRWPLARFVESVRM
jgi:hypothetical protein